MQTVKGDSGGIMFRYVLDQSDGQYNERGLYLEVDTDGTYGLFKFHRTSSDGPMNWTQLGADQSSIINTGYNKSNLVTIIAHDQQIYLYINKQFLAQFQDNTNANGEVDAGNFVLTAGEDTHPTETAFSNVQVWSVD